MTYDSYTVETDPFLIDLREQLNEMEVKVDALYRAWSDNPTDAQARIKYDAAWLRFDTCKMKYERALKAAIGL